MKYCIHILVSFLLLSSFVFADKERISDVGDFWKIKGKNYSATFTKQGQLKFFEENGKKTEILENVPLAFDIDGERISTANSQFKSSKVESGKLIFEFSHPKIDFKLILEPSEKYFDFYSTFTVKEGKLTSAYIPSKITLNPDDISAVNVASNWPKNMGVSLKSSFFKERKADDVVLNYTRGKANYGEAYRHLTGKSFPNLPYEKAKFLKAGRDAQEWFGKDTDSIIKLFETPYSHRPTLNADIQLIDSHNGGFLTGQTFGGKGAFFHVGGEVKYAILGQAMAYAEMKIYEKALERAKAMGDFKRRKVALISFTVNGDTGLGHFDNFNERFLKYGSDFYAIRTRKELGEALTSPETLMIVNRHLELGLPPENMDMNAFMDVLKTYIQNGGYWVERGNYPFHFEMVPEPFQKFTSGALGDFSHFDLKNANIAFYSIQLVEGKDFKKDIPYSNSRTFFEGTPKGAEMSRSFPYNIYAGESFTLPKTRVRFGETMQRGARSFCKDNGITKKLSEKVSADFLEKFKKSPIIRLWRNNLNFNAAVAEKLPVPSIVHISDYLYGGFDKQYPDNLPPRKEYASEEEFKIFIEKIHQRGNLFMPYTNNTWWCDNPKGPTFQKFGNDGLAKDANGNVYPELYGTASGFTACMWSPHSLEVTAKFIEGFRDVYKADIVFQDQTGSRAFNVLDTNPASPTRNSYLDGMLNSTIIDSKKIPLATEDGWSHLSDYEIIFCGYTFGIMEPRFREGWKFLWETYPKDTIEIINLAGALFQDKVTLTQHNLAGHLRDHKSITASLLYGLHLITNNINRHDHKDFDKELQLINWVAALQRAVSSKYIGVPMKSFKVDWVDIKTSDGNRIGRAKYGDMSIVANLNTMPLEDSGVTISPDGFLAKGGGVLAGDIKAVGVENVTDNTRFILQSSKEISSLELFATAGQTVIIPSDKKIKELYLGKTKIDFKEFNDGIKFNLPTSEKQYPLYWKFDVKYN